MWLDRVTENTSRFLRRHHGQADHADRQASDLLHAGADAFRDDAARGCPGWPKSPRAPASRLRRARTSLRTLGIEIAFSREGRTETRIIRMSASHEEPHSKTDSTVVTVGAVIDNSGSGHPPPGAEPIRQAHRQF
jgi:hypothetical protein